MNTSPAVVRRSYLSYQKTLICYDGVQLFAGRGAKNRWYICLAVPAEEDGEHFMCTPVSDGSMADYLYERIDLFALIKSSSNGKHYWIDMASETDKGYLLHEISDMPPEWMPDRQIFAGCHTEEFTFGVPDQTANLSVSDREIHIDGRWDAQDLSILPDLFSDNYSFLYSLESNQHRSNGATQRMFRKFPWRGGFSTVGFYRGLYNQIPRAHRLAIQGINYHSPGEITLSAVDVVVDQIRASISQFSEQRQDLQLLYKRLYDEMSARQLLGRSLDEIDPDPLDLVAVETAARELALAMRFQMIDQLLSLTDRSWIASAKILMSYFRRIKALADFFDSGKASFR